MDERYISVKVAAKRLSDIGLYGPTYLRLEVQFFTLLTAMLKHALTPRLQIPDAEFDRLSLMVEELMIARHRPSKCAALSEHLDKMIAAVEAEPIEHQHTI
jgi:hypothetical protein